MSCTTTERCNLPSSPIESGVHSTNIESLPAELLTVIFEMVAHNLIDNGRSNAPPSTFLSHVCVRWRAIALDCQELWSTFLPRTSVEWTAICLSRCHSKPLEVTVDSHYTHFGRNIEAATAQVMHHWPRIRTLNVRPALYPADDALELDEDSQRHLEILFSFLASPSECLEELELDLSLDVGIMLDVWVPVRLPDTMFASQYPPRLRRLQLTRCWLPAAPPTQLFAPNLRALELTNIKAWPDVDAMIGYLQTMPMLEQFAYRYWANEDIFDFRPSRSHHIRCVQFPHLTNLALDGFWLQNIAIFNYIAMPSCCTVTSDHREDWEHIDELPEAAVLQSISIHADAIMQHFAPATSCNVFYSSVEVRDHGIAAAVTPTSQGEQMFDEVTLLPSKHKSYFRIPDTEDEPIREAALRAYLVQPVFTNAQRLTFGADAWRLCPKVYDEYTAVRELYLEEFEDVEAFISAVRLKGSSLFPNLRRVILTKLFLTKPRREYLYELTEALRGAHVPQGTFDCLELEYCYNVPNIMEERLRAILGANCVVRHPISS